MLNQRNQGISARYPSPELNIIMFQPKTYASQVICTDRISLLQLFSTFNCPVIGKKVEGTSPRQQTLAKRPTIQTLTITIIYNFKQM